MHLDELRTEIACLAQILSTTLIDSQKKQNDIESRVEDLESEAFPQYDLDESDDILDQLEHEGYVGPAQGSSPREVLKTEVNNES